jgi:16S rRNA (guanine527-N7)-methyltransferase
MTETTDPTRALLDAGLAELGSPPDLAGPLTVLTHLLVRWAARMNLTGHRTPEAVARHLVLDALALAATALPVRPPQSLVDLGSGAGFPGLPIALVWPACRVTLVESRERRHHFQRAAIRALALTNVTALRGRSEDLTPRPHQIAIAQALARPALALARMTPWSLPGGWVALACSEDAPQIARPEAIEEASSVHYRVPLGGPRRVLWCGHLSDGGRPRRACDT